MEAEIKDLRCVVCVKSFTSAGYFEKHNNLYHSVDSPTKELGRKKENDWKHDVICRFQKMFDESGENVYDILKNMALRFQPHVKKYFGEPTNIPAFKSDSLKDLLYGSFPSTEVHLWIIFEHFKNQKPLKLQNSNTTQPPMPSSEMPQPMKTSLNPSKMEIKRLSDTMKKLEPHHLEEVARIVDANESHSGDEYEIPIGTNSPASLMILYG